MGLIGKKKWGIAVRRASLLIKPASSLCNLRCRYCFYHDVASRRERYCHGVMTPETAKAVILRAYERVGTGPSEVAFNFQGGEPLLAGLDFFERFTAAAEEYRPQACRVTYALQTNATLLDDAWAAFFCERDFLLGVSLDPDKGNHDWLRPDADGEGTYDAVLRGIKALERRGAAYNLLTVVTRSVARHPRRVYTELKKTGCRYWQFIPCLKPLDGGQPSSYDLAPRDYAAFLKQLWRLWKEEWEKGETVSIRLFDNLLGMLRGQEPEQCGAAGSCVMQPVVEADGSVYPCDFYVLDAYCCGNVKTDTLEMMENSVGARAFLREPQAFPAPCASCRVWRLCAGGCRRARPLFAAEEGYCPYQDFLYACLQDMALTAERL